MTARAWYIFWVVGVLAALCEGPIVSAVRATPGTYERWAREPGRVPLAPTCLGKTHVEVVPRYSYSDGDLVWAVLRYGCLGVVEESYWTHTATEANAVQDRWTRGGRW